MTMLPAHNPPRNMITYKEIMTIKIPIVVDYYVPYVYKQQILKF